MKRPGARAWLRLRIELARVICAPDVAETFRKSGGKPLALSDAAMRALIQRDVERWSRRVRELDLKPE